MYRFTVLLTLACSMIWAHNQDQADQKTHIGQSFQQRGVNLIYQLPTLVTDQNHSFEVNAIHKGGRLFTETYEITGRDGRQYLNLFTSEESALSDLLHLVTNEKEDVGIIVKLNHEVLDQFSLGTLLYESWESHKEGQLTHSARLIWGTMENLVGPTKGPQLHYTLPRDPEGRDTTLVIKSGGDVVGMKVFPSTSFSANPMDVPLTLMVGDLSEYQKLEGPLTLEFRDERGTYDFFNFPDFLDYNLQLRDNHQWREVPAVTAIDIFSHHGKNSCTDACHDNYGICLMNCTSSKCVWACDIKLDNCLDICQQNQDTDGDGIPDRIDNCPYTPNPGQRDCDQDGLGDVCDDNNWLLDYEQIGSPVLIGQGYYHYYELLQGLYLDYNHQKDCYVRTITQRYRDCVTNMYEYVYIYQYFSVTYCGLPGPGGYSWGGCSVSPSCY